MSLLANRCLLASFRSPAFSFVGKGQTKKAFGLATVQNNCPLKGENTCGSSCKVGCGCKTPELSKLPGASYVKYVTYTNL